MQSAVLFFYVVECHMPCKIELADQFGRKAVDFLAMYRLKVIAGSLAEPVRGLVGTVRRDFAVHGQMIAAQLQAADVPLRDPGPVRGRRKALRQPGGSQQRLRSEAAVHRFEREGGRIAEFFQLSGGCEQLRLRSPGGHSFRQSGECPFVVQRVQDLEIVAEHAAATGQLFPPMRDIKDFLARRQEQIDSGRPDNGRQRRNEFPAPLSRRRNMEKFFYRPRAAAHRKFDAVRGKYVPSGIPEPPRQIQRRVGAAACEEHIHVRPIHPSLAVKSGSTA
ncbi:hypothetical protein PC41400_20035 [Paenibacillus chitinolyticus]|uniref:Uncharacterized protein n=1 Tax=Paenibacillus chitinolyticus TaxID=79263 RepID=A0A410X052_9BACL|nr:hypothetical protein PC41400_20035 [Paenibacillus chitinolyticus]